MCYNVSVRGCVNVRVRGCVHECGTVVHVHPKRVSVGMSVGKWCGCNMILVPHSRCTHCSVHVSCRWMCGQLASFSINACMERRQGPFSVHTQCKQQY